MCYAIIKVSYHNDKEPSAFLELDDMGSVEEKLNEVKGRPGVKKVSVYHHKSSHELVSEWHVNNSEEK